jgi:hypothetical protein
MSITAMKQALEFLYRVRHWEEGKPDLHDMKEALRAAISEQEKCEPVGYARYEKDKLVLMVRNTVSMDMFPIYTHPAPVEKCEHVPVTTFGGDYCIKCDAPVESNDYPAPVPAGYALVPVEPTDEMYMSLLDVKEVEDAREDMRNLWAAMLAAAPKPGEMK